jgi:hypothetical protein
VQSASALHQVGGSPSSAPAAEMDSEDSGMIFEKLREHYSAVAIYKPPQNNALNLRCF